MINEIFNNYNFKPKFNLEWYKGNDLYSEGDIENIIIEILAKNPPEDYTNAINNNLSWSTYYHLTHTRKNILNWYPFKEGSSILEIGCGFGAITNMLCEKGEKVVAIELSKRRATGTLLRCREKENLEIVVGNLNDISFTEKYDYITLIGVLEYQGNYTQKKDGNDPYKEFLKKIKSLLKPHGKLLIAIENKYGLKYWCGAKEDHTSIPFDGINQYSLSKKDVRTFSKNELISLIEDVGFNSHYNYYPMPDYKLPQVIYSEKILPKNENMLDMQFYYVPNSDTLIADEKRIYKDLIDNNVFEFFSNSFLIECSEEGDVGEITFASLNSKRIPEYQICTRFTKENMVEKISLDKAKRNDHIFQIYNNQFLLKNKINIVESIFENNIIKSQYRKLPLLEDELYEAYVNKDREKIFYFWELLQQEIINSSEHISPEENILIEYGLIKKDIIKQNEIILKYGFIDMIARNAFYDEHKCIWFDQEWLIEKVPANYILYRAINIFYSSYTVISKCIPLISVATRFHLIEDWHYYQILEQLFINEVIDKVHLRQYNAFIKREDKIIRNINKLIQ